MRADENSSTSLEIREKTCVRKFRHVLIQKDDANIE